MENVAHALLGYRIGQLRAFSAVGPRAPLIGLIAANAPDLDVLLYVLDRDVGTWEHRGFTHSLLGWPVLVLAGALASSRWLRTGRYRDHLALWTVAIASHALLDVPTTWGTQLLWPSDQRFGLELIFIVDPAFWLLLGLLPWLWSRRRAATISPLDLAHHAATRGIAGLAGWYVVAAVGKALALHQAVEPVAAVPSPLAPLYWTGFTVPAPGDTEVRRYWLTPWSCEPAGTFAAPRGAAWDVVVSDHAGERDAWMSIAPVILREQAEGDAVEITVVDLAYSNRYQPENFLFGHHYVLAQGRVVSRSDAALDP